MRTECQPWRSSLPEPTCPKLRRTTEGTDFFPAVQLSSVRKWKHLSQYHVASLACRSCPFYLLWLPSTRALSLSLPWWPVWPVWPCLPGYDIDTKPLPAICTHPLWMDHPPFLRRNIPSEANFTRFPLDVASRGPCHYTPKKLVAPSWVSVNY